MGNGTVDDKRQASSLTTTLAGYVMTATLAVFGAQAVVVTFVTTNRIGLGVFYVISVVAAVLLVVSLYLGGRGVWELISRGFGGDWAIRTKGGMFGLQTLLALAGTVLLLVSAFLGEPKPSPPT